MKCPFCQREMEKGFLQSGRSVLWTPQKHRLSLKPKNAGELIVAEDPLGGATVPGFCCKSCRRILLEYPAPEG